MVVLEAARREYFVQFVIILYKWIFYVEHINPKVLNVLKRNSVLLFKTDFITRITVSYLLYTQRRYLLLKMILSCFNLQGVW